MSAWTCYLANETGEQLSLAGYELGWGDWRKKPSDSIATGFDTTFEAETGLAGKIQGWVTYVGPRGGCTVSFDVPFVFGDVTKSAKATGGYAVREAAPSGEDGGAMFFLEKAPPPPPTVVHAAPIDAAGTGKSATVQAAALQIEVTQIGRADPTSKQFFIDADSKDTSSCPDPTMPTIHVKLTSKEIKAADLAAATFNWKAEVSLHKTFYNDWGHTKPFDRDAEFSSAFEGTAKGGEFDISFSKFIGGKLKITITSVINGTQIHLVRDDLGIWGKNPTVDQIRAYVATFALGKDPAHCDDETTVRKIIHQESGWQQFQPITKPVEDSPYWSGDQLGGVGLFQITRELPTLEEIWNWKTHVRKGINIFIHGKKPVAAGYPGSIASNANFKSDVDAINARRLAAKLPPLTVTVAPYTVEQLRDDSIRGYNGFSGTSDRYSRLLHEFVLEKEDGKMKLYIDASGRSATTKWVRVPGTAAARGGSGDPNYVNNVNGKSP